MGVTWHVPRRRKHVSARTGDEGLGSPSMLSSRKIPGSGISYLINSASCAASHPYSLPAQRALTSPPPPLSQPWGFSAFPPPPPKKKTLLILSVPPPITDTLINAGRVRLNTMLHAKQWRAACAKPTPHHSEKKKGEKKKVLETSLHIKVARGRGH